MARPVAVAVLSLLALLLLLPAYGAALLAGAGAAMRVARLWHRLVVRLIGVRIEVTGTPAPDRPLLILANHVSWLDIPVLASLLPVSFVAKQDVADWPVVGWLARMQRSVFVDRGRRHMTGAQASEIAARLGAGEALVLFAEGTSGDGNHVLPFRSSLIGAAHRAAAGVQSPVAVQPVALAYTGWLGLPAGRRERPRLAWYGDMDLLPHLRRLLAAGAIDVRVVFGPASPAASTTDRKVLAAEAGLWVRRTVAELNGGRDPAGRRRAIRPAH